MSWWDHGVKWDSQWHFEYAATMFMAWSAGENIFKSSDGKSVKGSDQAEVYSLKNLRWQARFFNLVCTTHLGQIVKLFLCPCRFCLMT